MTTKTTTIEARTARGRALARAQKHAAELAALPLVHGSLPEFRRLSRMLLDELDEAGMLPPALECDGCGERRDECLC